MAKYFKLLRVYPVICYHSLNSSTLVINYHIRSFPPIDQNCCGLNICDKLIILYQTYHLSFPSDSGILSAGIASGTISTSTTVASSVHLMPNAVINHSGVLMGYDGYANAAGDVVLTIAEVPDQHSVGKSSVDASVGIDVSSVDSDDAFDGFFDDFGGYDGDTKVSGSGDLVE